MMAVHSPTRMFLLPSYAEDLAQFFAALPTPSPRIRQPQFDTRIAEFLDIEAVESSNSRTTSMI